MNNKHYTDGHYLCNLLHRVEDTDWKIERTPVLLRWLNVVTFEGRHQGTRILVFLSRKDKISFHLTPLTEKAATYAIRPGEYWHGPVKQRLAQVGLNKKASAEIIRILTQ